jgi:hypothetical protein
VSIRQHTPAYVSVEELPTPSSTSSPRHTYPSIYLCVCVCVKERKTKRDRLTSEPTPSSTSSPPPPVRRVPAYETPLRRTRHLPSMLPGGTDTATRSACVLNGSKIVGARLPRLDAGPIRQHASTYVSICQHTSAHVSIRSRPSRTTSSPVTIRPFVLVTLAGK